MQIRHRYIGIVIGVAFLIALVTHGRLRDYDAERYAPPAPKAILNASKIAFAEQAAKLGIAVKHVPFFPNSDARLNTFLELVTIKPYVASIDVNADGYQDLFLISQERGQPNRLFINRQGKGFDDATQQIAFLNEGENRGDSYAIWADFTEDGKPDLFMARYGCHAFYRQKENLNFEELPQKTPVCSAAQGAALADFNGDGHLDVVLANQLSMKLLNDSDYLLRALLGNAGRAGEGKGGKNMVLFGDGVGQFTIAPYAVFDHENPNFSTSAGVAYINDDQFPDLLITNDYSYDELYLNREGAALVAVTDEFIPRFFHGFSGMNTDFADYNQDGLIDVFVTNGWGPPSARSPNLMWKKREDGNGFENVSFDAGTHRCGWAWGAKFADYDLDGDLDLFVVNGRGRGSKATSFRDSRSFNFLRTQIRIMPNFIRTRVDQMAEQITPNFSESNLQLYGFDRNCLFEQVGEQFYDVAEKAGIADLENGQSLVRVDIDNDGKQDIVVGNSKGSFMLYMNQSKTEGGWVGLDVRTADDQPGHGARIIVQRDDGVPMVSEIFVTNGFRGQNDPRVVFGLGKGHIKDASVKVVWPDGSSEIFFNVEKNQYNKLTYGNGTPEKTILP